MFSTDIKCTSYKKHRKEMNKVKWQNKVKMINDICGNGNEGNT